MKTTSLLSGILALGLTIIFQGCHMGDSHQLSQNQQKNLQSTFESIQASHKTILQSYRTDSANVPANVKTLYRNMENMHQQMAQNHSHLMTNHRHGMGPNDNNRSMMGAQMHLKIQNGISAEWYQQMMNMHQQMVQLHNEKGRLELSALHQKQSKQFRKLMEMVPHSDKTTEFSNPKGDPALLNGATLFTQNCSSCHGKDGQGFGNSFPPLINTKWITGDKSIPVRIIHDGLTGSIDVQETTYQGNMPSFKARLSLAEIAAIVNYLRKESKGDFPAVTQEDVINITRSYAGRSKPWTADELLGE